MSRSSCLQLTARTFATNHFNRTFQAVSKNVFIRADIALSALETFLLNVLYKFTYLLTLLTYYTCATPTRSVQHIHERCLQGDSARQAAVLCLGLVRLLYGSWSRKTQHVRTPMQATALRDVKIGLGLHVIIIAVVTLFSRPLIITTIIMHNIKL